ncbi:MAG: hypothetical protein C5B50_19245 [Verrucomicrobia bacterium]|nr:MAG: hypothetical protein C5B50_19245 [Verrucomicrobiota bacterium]
MRGYIDPQSPHFVPLRSTTTCPILRQMLADTSGCAVLGMAYHIRQLRADYELDWLKSYSMVAPYDRQAEIKHQLSGETDTDKILSLHNELALIRESAITHTARVAMRVKSQPLIDAQRMLHREMLETAKRYRTEAQLADKDFQTGMEYEPSPVAKQYDGFIGNLERQLARQETVSLSGAVPLNPQSGEDGLGTWVSDADLLAGVEAAKGNTV